jgi:macrolide transport system ATP-binding/permease protein
LPEHEVRTILARLGITGGDVHKPCRVMSGGERVKVAFARLFASRLNMLVMDEPTNHIDLYTAEALDALLRAWEGTLLLVTHDRRLTAHAADRLLFVENGTVRAFEGTWDEYSVRFAVV